MKLLVAFLRLIRWPNLLFIAFTQWLFYFSVVEYLSLKKNIAVPNISLHHLLFYLLIAASVLIAAAGYIINDYFDRHIDAINKPEKVVGNTLKSFPLKSSTLRFPKLPIPAGIFFKWSFFKLKYCRFGNFDQIESENCIF